MERAFKGIWIPAEIWLNENLTLLEKVFLVEIDSLDNENGCYASNEYFANFFKLSKNRCSEVIKSLEKKGLISIKYIYKKNSKAIDKRVIKVFDNSNTPIRNLDRPIRKIEEGYSENCEDNNTVFNNTFINTTTREVVVKNIKDYFNQLEDRDIEKVASIFLATNKEISYLVEKLELTKNNNVRDVIGYLLAAIKNDYKSSISNYKCFSPTFKTRFHNHRQTFTKYTPDELEQILIESQKDKFN